MFCQQCGAEAPARALTCPTCGHDLGRLAAELRSSMTLPEASSSAPGIGAFSHPVASSPSSASIQTGDLDRPGWPKDALGRILLLIILMLEVDLFLLPWRLVGGLHETLPTSAGLAIAVLVLLAAVPLCHPQLRRQPIWAVLPILVGGICLGIGAAFWANPTPPAIFVSGFYSSTLSSIREVNNGGAIPDVGLFGFVIGALILVVIGYRLFLAAARYEGELPVALAVTDRPRNVPPVAVPQPALPLPGVQEVIAVAATSEQDAPPRPRIQTAVARPPEIALPGSEAWSRTLESPVFQHPKSSVLRRSHR